MKGHSLAFAFLLTGLFCADPALGLQDEGAEEAEVEAPAEEIEPARAPDLAPLNDVTLKAAFVELEGAHPELVSVEVIGKSRAGSEILAVRVAAGEVAADRPALLLVANVEGPDAWTSSLALDHVRELASRYGEDEAVTAFLDTTTLWVVPRANPDSAAHRFGMLVMENRGTGHGVDNDRDGRSGENGPSDFESNGTLLSMRIPDPEGEWMEDPADRRILIKADRTKGERGRWRLEREGRDWDGDEGVDEDPKLDAQVNRNFPYRWKEHAPESGRYPLDEPEAKALVDFVLAHRTIGMVLVYGDQDNLAETPKGIADNARANKRVPAAGVLASDVKLLSTLGERYRNLTKNETKGTGGEHGTFQAWAYRHRGLLTLNVRPWSLPRKKAKKEKGAKKDSGPKPSADAERLAWLEERGITDRFRDWKSMVHPELGEVEVGGFMPYATIEPPTGPDAPSADGHLDFLVSLGADLCRVGLVDVTAHDLGAGLLEVKATVENSSLLPSRTAQGNKTRTTRAVRVRLVMPAGATLVAGSGQQFLSGRSGAGIRREFRWLVRGAAAEDLAITVDSDHAGSDRAVPEVR